MEALPESSDHGSPVVVNIVNDGDLLLDVNIELKSTRLYNKPNHDPAKAKATTVQTIYRVSSTVLANSSPYFATLIRNGNFREAGLISDAHNSLEAEGVDPSKADASRLPSITIFDDNEATEAAHHHSVFHDMLLALHHRRRILPPPAREFQHHLATLAIIADRFDCVAAVAEFVDTSNMAKCYSMKTQTNYCGNVVCTEQVLRQKILVAYQLDMPTLLSTTSRDLIMRGSVLWGPLQEDRVAGWWNLPDGLEHELRHRRDCILNALASVPDHFLGLYLLKGQRCRMGYNSSLACDAFQLGQMVKYLKAKGLLFLVDFRPASIDSIPDTSQLHVNQIMDLLRRIPNYQIDRHHSNCGPRVHIQPILDFLRLMLSADAIGISKTDWKKRRAEVTWDGCLPKDDGDPSFFFMPSLPPERKKRGRYESKQLSRKARRLFMAKRWFWTPDGF
ncbi:hypothetical protein CP533_6347 [Ophiocordyceps camponoti-saundersi (nom. inval.)]|nr:hypothetical protein CP533_6347 [Ophiocordyceps camponoti-saundersi (nom. inval.)]